MARAQASAAYTPSLLALSATIPPSTTIPPCSPQPNFFLQLSQFLLNTTQLSLLALKATNTHGIMASESQNIDVQSGGTEVASTLNVSGKNENAGPSHTDNTIQS